VNEKLDNPGASIYENLLFAATAKVLLKLGAARRFRSRNGNETPTKSKRYCSTQPPLHRRKVNIYFSPQRQISF
jgi:hypothetical protein